MAEAQEALAFIQKVPATGGGSLYEHLTKLVVKVLEERPGDAVDVLETALLVKKAGLDQRESAPLVPAGAAADAAKTVALAGLFGTTDVPIDPETGEPVSVDTPNEYECEDIQGDAALLEALGVGLGRCEAVDVALAAKRLGQDPRHGVATVRFFGKFLGSHADYYVFETTLQNPPAEPEEQQAEGSVPLEWNSGSNGYVYFVCSTPGCTLSQLPHVTPAQVKAARRIKKLLTGRLTSQVSSYPVFPGTEANYLRAQIARIAATTVLCPAGLFVVNEDGGLDKAEEWSPLPDREMGAAANWAHRYPHLKEQGRCAVHRREPPEGEEDTFEWTEEEQEEGPELLSPAEGDAEVLGGAAWTPLFSSAAEHVKYQVAGLRSNQWPGAFCACQGARFTNVYVGWGVKNAAFVPTPPPPVAREYDAALVESRELPRKAAPPAEGEEAGDE
ncbi:MAG: flagellar radial spoke protein 4 [Monoraphidium minutum]|nr:MAG: flagellar radial spoke protein 4 [Monoraphidium minutum]